MQQTPGCHRPSGGVLGSILLMVLVATASVVNPTAGSPMDVYPYKTLGKGTVTDVKLNAQSMCYCRTYCMIQVNCTTVTMNSSHSGCVVPFTLVDDVGCLNFVQELKTFSDAQGACKSMNAQLYDAPSQEKLDLLRKYLRENKLGSDLWVGVKAGKWTRSNRDLNASEWGLGEPNDGPTACARMNEFADYNLKDRDCSVKYYYICQIA
ncbi:uncharacterized protein [Macrobrachium rosenbergii]|uniref:uncharacterized protein n=1 Tax=Macrobrachium rosenbergii TaxID=79674 RepID=UPI0034D77024